MSEINEKIAGLRGHEDYSDYDRSPDYEHDLNAAMPLLLELPDSAIRHSTLTGIVTIEWFSKVNGSYEVLVVAQNVSIAHTICEAWLQWKGISDE